ncbi:MAG: ABC transporter ATP-binding protein [Deltaproteobacteria bacterium]|nr:ABC transporter ATP-binding protein [Deltaproteobacteria bacterium]MBT4088808.1 ABC transporter ATP-binding protein [Deltaproteobacteria bacterium]MBT4269531.1 ABC transporter ATP-binding protein [Deltaproteobacteria bacterium]MBT4642626.1 ABC transporter ATP-binding protein [Deltaproteobacteria bacterium]MBT6501289.1 ABC transporter ATP-binding protein [Deltaproteobacteria bacterium]
MSSHEKTALALQDVNSFYGEMQVLRDTSLSVKPNEVVALFGPNGHGKSTLLKTIAGLHPPTSGSIRFNESEISNMPSDKIVAMGMALISEDRNLFPEMTVLENLNLGAYNRSARKKIKENLEIVFSLFPRLAERKTQMVSTMSGGEARMVAVGRGLMSNASMLLIDEPSIGLSPIMKQTVFNAVKVIKSRGNFSILIVEQEVDYPLSVADRVYLLRKGRIVMERQSDDIDKAEIEKAYF